MEHKEATRVQGERRAMALSVHWEIQTLTLSPADPFQKRFRSQEVWWLPLVPALWKQKQVDLYGFKDSLFYIASSGQLEIHRVCLPKIKNKAIYKLN